MNKKQTKLTTDNVITLAEAKTKLNGAMLRLRTQYGFAPEKGITLEEMKSRCDKLVSEIDTAVREYVEETGQAPDRMKNLPSNLFPIGKFNGLAEYANVPDEKLKRAPLYTAEAIGNLLNFNADYLLKAEHEATVKNRTREEWSRAEYEYVEKSDYNLHDLYDDLMKKLDDTFEPISYEEYRQERRKWKQCRYFACDNYFPINKEHMESESFKRSGIKFRRTDAKYCCSDCRKSQENAIKRLEKTGTLLPEHAYEYILDDAREKRAAKEVATEQEKLEKVADI